MTKCRTKGYVAHAIPQRRNIQFENAQPVVQILAELALPDHLRQISVGRADKPKVGMELTLMSYLLDFPGFKDTEKLRLHGQRQFTDFIQKMVPVSAISNLPFTPPTLAPVNAPVS